jgi:1-aminocyclopropane-1-carboxylate deaminase/D-cysteine desulfhydrase-like pyridoxal-dependent ACC family enzyme
LVDSVVFPQPATDHVREQLLADVAAGASLYPTGSYLGVPLAVWKRRRAPDALWLPPGGSSPLGTLGYVSGGLELQEQIAAGLLPAPDVVYVALGSCGTAAGLLLGLAGTPARPAPPCEVVAVRVVDRLVANASATRRLAARTAALLAEHGERWFNQCRRPSLRVEHRFFGGAYGRPTSAGEAAVARAAACGLTLEPTYTGKAMAALLDDADSGRLANKRVLFLHSFSSVDLSALIAAGRVDALPPPLRRYFAGTPGRAG